MTSPCSAFQTLPLHIIDNILDYLLNVYILRRSYRPAVCPILHSCHSWRNALMNSKYYELNLSHVPTIGLKSQVAGPEFSYRDNVPLHSISNKTKKVHFNLWSLSSVFDGDLFYELSQPEYAALTLPSVKDFSISFDRREGLADSLFFSTQDHADNAQRKMVRFSQYIRALMPSLKSVSVYVGFIEPGEYRAALEAALSKMIASLLDGIKAVTYWNPGMSIGDFALDLDASSGLTYFKYRFDTDGDRGLEIVLRNSSTLQCIVSFLMPGKFIERMLYHENGDPIVYDCLETLAFSDTIGRMTQGAEDHTCHFPSLKKLTVDEFDQVLIDALLNGTKMLEHLRLYTSYVTMDGINDRQMFRLCRLQNLKHLVLAYSGRFVAVMPTDDSSSIAQYARLVESLAKQPRCLQSFSLTSSQYETKLVDIFSTSCAFSSIQKLKFTMQTMRFKDIVSVIRNCPQLQVLTCSKISDYPSIDGLRDEKLVRHLETKAYPLSKYLTSIFIAFSSSDSPQAMKMAMALLVVGCPRLSNIDCFDSHRESLRKVMQDQAENPMFSNYRHRLQNVAAND